MLRSRFLLFSTVLCSFVQVLRLSVAFVVVFLLTNTPYLVHEVKGGTLVWEGNVLTVFLFDGWNYSGVTAITVVVLSVTAVFITYLSQLCIVFLGSSALGRSTIAIIGDLVE